MATGERLLIASYPGGRGERARERLCPAITTSVQVATLSCIVVSGESGAPVLRLTAARAGSWRRSSSPNRGPGHQPFAFTVQAARRLRQLAAIYLD